MKFSAVMTSGDEKYLNKELKYLQIFQKLSSLSLQQKYSLFFISVD